MTSQPDPTPAPAQQQGALSPERLDEIEWEHAAITDRLDNGGAIRTDALRAAYERHMADLLPEVIRLREQHAHLLAARAPQPVAISPEREAEIRHRWEYVKAGFERTYLGDLLGEIDALRAQHEGDRRMLRLAINAQKRRAEIAEQQLSAHEGAAQIIGDHIAALGDWQRASALDGQTIAGLEAEVAEREERFRAATDRQIETFRRLVAERRGAEQQLAEARAERDEWRSAWERRRAWHEAGLKAEQALADERAATARLRDQVATARAQLDAWQDNRPGATVQAAAATLAASPGPEAPEPAALEPPCPSCGEGKDQHVTICMKGATMRQMPNVNAAAGVQITYDPVPHKTLILDTEPAAPEPREDSDGAV